MSSDVNLYHLLSLFTVKPKITGLDKLYKSKSTGSKVGAVGVAKGCILSTAEIVD